MKIPNGSILTCQCKLTTPFHTKRQDYTNLWKTAPFILGSTLRGLILSFLIQKYYSQEEIDADAFKQSGIVSYFFSTPNQAFFSFGTFEKNIAEEMETHTRISLDRNSGSVSEGALLSYEIIPAGECFSFSIIFLNKDEDFVEQILDDIKEMLTTKTFKIGGLKSIGLGEFEVVNHTISSIEIFIKNRLSTVQNTQNQNLAILEFTTPYVLSDGNKTWQDTADFFKEKFCSELSKIPGLEPDELLIEKVDSQFIPDFVGRWSFELDQRETRLVAWKGSRIYLKTKNIRNIFQLLMNISLFGLGEWNQFGFGRFEIKND